MITLGVDVGSLTGKAVLLGDGRPYLVALIVPDFVNLVESPQIFTGLPQLPAFVEDFFDVAFGQRFKRIIGDVCLAQFFLGARQDELSPDEQAFIQASTTDAKASFTS